MTIMSEKASDPTYVSQINALEAILDRKAPYPFRSIIEVTDSAALKTFRDKYFLLEEDSFSYHCNHQKHKPILMELAAALSFISLAYRSHWFIQEILLLKILGN